MDLKSLLNQCATVDPMTPCWFPALKSPLHVAAQLQQTITNEGLAADELSGAFGSCRTRYFYQEWVETKNKAKRFLTVYVSKGLLTS